MFSDEPNRRHDIVIAHLPALLHDQRRQLDDAVAVRILHVHVRRAMLAWRKQYVDAKASDPQQDGHGTKDKQLGLLRQENGRHDREARLISEPTSVALAGSRKPILGLSSASLRKPSPELCRGALCVRRDLQYPSAISTGNRVLQERNP